MNWFWCSLWNILRKAPPWRWSQQVAETCVRLTISAVQQIPTHNFTALVPYCNHSRHQAHVTLWTNAVTGRRRRPSAPRGGRRLATNPAASGSGVRGGGELARTACHLPQGTKSLGRKVRVLFRLQYGACYTPCLPTPLALITLVISGKEHKPWSFSVTSQLYPLFCVSIFHRRYLLVP